MGIDLALERAVQRSGTYRTALFFTRRIKRAERSRRTTRRMVAITEQLWFELLGGTIAPPDPRKIMRGISLRSRTYSETDET